MYISILEKIGENAISMDNGEILYQLMLNEIKREKNKNETLIITLDFKDVKVISSPFFNASISYLLKDYSIEFCQKHILFKNIRIDTKEILNYSIQNAIEFYSKNK